MDKEMELAKSWFVLAQLTMILAGFLIASAGITITNTQNTLSWGLDKVGQIAVTNCSQVENISNYQKAMVGNLDYAFNTVNSGIEVYLLLWKFGGALVIISLFLFMWGYWRLDKIGEK